MARRSVASAPMQLRIFTEPQEGATYDQLLQVAHVTEETGFDVTLSEVRPGELVFKVFASCIGAGGNTRLGEKRLRVPYPANQGTG